MPVARHPFFIPAGALAWLASLLLPATALGGGFALDTQSARATSLGTAMTAHVDDPSALFYNAAGLVHGEEGLAVQLGAHALLPNVTFQPAAGGPVTASQTGTLFPPHGYLRWKPSRDVAVGVGLSTPFGNTTRWPRGWVGEQLSLRGAIDAIDLGASLAVRLHERVRLGLGADALRATVEQERGLGAAGGGGSVKLQSSAWGLGANAGLQLDVVPEVLALGVAYRAEVPLELSGTATFRDIPAPLSAILSNQPVTGALTLPQQWQLGVMLRPLPALRVAFDTWWVDWSSVKALAVTFQTPALSSSAPLDWRARWNFHLGAEYAAGDALKLRLGLKYDPSPAPAATLSPAIPDSDRMALALGAGTALGRFTLDAAWQLTLLRARPSTLPLFPGDYSGFANVFALTLGWKP